MKSRLILIVLFLISHGVAFLVGSATGRYFTFGDLVRETQRADTWVNLGHYAAYRDIASDIKGGNYRSAKCNAELIASLLFDDARRCARNTECWNSLDEAQRARIPEALGKAPVPFDYIEAKDGIRRCADGRK